MSIREVGSYSFADSAPFPSGLACSASAVYCALRTPSEIAQFDLNLKPLSPERVKCGEGPIQLELATQIGSGPEHLYCLNRTAKNLSRFKVGTKGALEEPGEKTLPTEPTYMVFAPNGHFLYLASGGRDEEGKLTVYERAENGVLTQVQQIAIPKGASAELINSVGAMATDGSVLVASGIVQGAVTGGPFGEKQRAELGYEAYAFTINAETGALTKVGSEAIFKEIKAGGVGETQYATTALCIRAGKLYAASTTTFDVYETATWKKVQHKGIGGVTGESMHSIISQPGGEALYTGQETSSQAIEQELGPTGLIKKEGFTIGNVDRLAVTLDNANIYGSWSPEGQEEAEGKPIAKSVVRHYSTVEAPPITGGGKDAPLLGVLLLGVAELGGAGETGKPGEGIRAPTKVLLPTFNNTITLNAGVNSVSFFAPASGTVPAMSPTVMTFVAPSAGVAAPQFGSPVSLRNPVSTINIVGEES